MGGVSHVRLFHVRYVPHSRRTINFVFHSTCRERRSLDYTERISDCLHVYRKLEARKIIKEGEALRQAAGN